jgi:hypothetical protein
MSFSKMFQYMCITFRENIMSFLKNQVLMRSCYLYVPWSVAASSLMLSICKRYNCKGVPGDGAHVPKHVGEAHLSFVFI